MSVLATKKQLIGIRQLTNEELYRFFPRLKSSINRLQLEERSQLRCASKTGITIAFICSASFALAQQSGGIEGQVLWRSGAAASEIVVTAESDVMPRSRTATTDTEGQYELDKLIPGVYRVSLQASNGASKLLTATVILGRSTVLDIVLGEPKEREVEEIVVIGQRVTVQGEASISNAIDGDSVHSFPIGTNYRDLMKLAPGVQYTQDSVRGPSAGGNGQDNVYLFDGVDVSLPMFGTLSTEPSSHDIDQVAFERGGVSAVGFNRSGGFTMNSASRSGTNEFRAEIEYVTRPHGLVANSDALPGDAHKASYDWIIVNGGGPLVPSRLLGFSSIFRPSESRRNKATAYGPVKNYSNIRAEYFVKFTYVPTDSVLVNVSYRTSDREENGVSIGQYEADSVSIGGRTEQDVLSLDGSWTTSYGLTIAFQYSDYALSGTEQPDVLLDIQPSLDGRLDIANLDQMGHLQVPSRIEGSDRFNTAIEPIIRKYGYLDELGNRAGGGAVGAHSRINQQSFFRQGLDWTVDHEVSFGDVVHELHFGIRRTEASERLLRLSNGWGRITVPAGVDLADDETPIFYVATVQRMSLRQEDDSVVSPINSYIKSMSLEFNDTIRFKDFELSAGFLASQDTLYGQGLRKTLGTYSGFERAPGEKYRMYTIRWKDMVQPRLGVTWKWNEESTLFVNFARYNPEANSLARAASWDRNTHASLQVLFDESGRIIQHEPLPGSSGKVFQDDLTPRRIDEWIIGARRLLPCGLVLSTHFRRRVGSHFWEDTGNLSRMYDNAPAHIAAEGAYVPDLDDIRTEIGGSSYVIAELDDAYTNYWEAAVEAEWKGERGYISASYLRSQYTGNFDQDNTSGSNDANLFIGSSNLADGYGRQLWDKKDGILRGDRPHILKIFGYLNLPWNATAGMYSFYQSGQPWEAWDAVAYDLPSYFSSTIRYAEKAGSKRSPSHWQFDLSYTHRFRLMQFINPRLRIEIFNLFDRQTGYNVDPYVHSATYGQARSHFSSRRVQISLTFDISRDSDT